MNWRAMALCAVIVVTQERPSFSGHWELVASADVPPGTAIAIDIAESRQPPRVLSVTRYFEGGDAETHDYPFGISGLAGGISVRGGVPLGTTAVQSVKWDDAAIVIDREWPPDPDVHERWSINSEGELLIEASDRPLVIATKIVSLRYRRR